MARQRRPKVAVWKFASCDGCQLTLLNCEEELLAVAGEVEIAYFLEASRAVVRGPYDLSLVEGSISTPHDAARIQMVRRVSRVLVTIGACATAGGIQALRNFADEEACLGPITQAGCGAICPAYQRGCYGCYGPMETPNATALADWWKHLGVPDGDIARALRTFNAWAEPFRTESERREPH